MGYQSTTKDRIYSYILGFIYVVLAILLAVMLFKIWPPTPWPSDSDVDGNVALANALLECDCPQPSPTPTNPASPAPAGATAISSGTSPAASPGTSPAASPATSPPSSPTASPAVSPAASPISSPSPLDAPARMPIKLLRWCLRTTFDERLLLLVIIAGMLGAFVHGATSLADYIGNNRFNRSWTWFYLLRPVIGMALALVFYFVIRGGFLTTSGGAKDINPYGIAALAGLVGMFSKQATDKLGEVFGTLFRSAEGEGDAKRKDPLKPKATSVTINRVEPPEIVAGSTGNSIKVAGTSFSSTSTVWLDDKPQNTRFENAESLVADIANELAAKPGTYKLKVVNSRDSESPSVDFRVVPSARTRGAAVEKPVTGEGGDNELIDGCDVDLKADTADEELPITEGGVK